MAEGIKKCTQCGKGVEEATGCWAEKRVDGRDRLYFVCAKCFEKGENLASRVWWFIWAFILVLLILLCISSVLGGFK